MALTSRTVTVTTSATRLDGTTSVEGPWGQSIAVYNAGAVTVYLGGTDVTTANGAPVAASSWGPSFEIGTGDAVYGIVASGTADVRVVEITAG